MAKKPYCRSFRYSENTKKILDEYYEGDFDKLVHYVYARSLEQQHIILSLQKDIENLENRKKDLICQINILSCMKTYFSRLDFEYNQFYDKFQNIIKNIENV